MKLTFASLSEPYASSELVTIPVPVDGAFEDLKFRPIFRRFSDDERTEILRGSANLAQKLQDGGEVEDGDRQFTDEAVTRKVIAGWQDWSTGEDVPFDEQSLAVVLRLHGAPGAIALNWLQSVEQRAPEGNSEGLPSTS